MDVHQHLFTSLGPLLLHRSIQGPRSVHVALSCGPWNHYLWTTGTFTTSMQNMPSPTVAKYVFICTLHLHAAHMEGRSEFFKNQGEKYTHECDSTDFDSPRTLDAEQCMCECIWHISSCLRSLQYLCSVVHDLRGIWSISHSPILILVVCPVAVRVLALSSKHHITLLCSPSPKRGTEASTERQMLSILLYWSTDAIDKLDPTNACHRHHSSTCRVDRFYKH